MKKIIISILCVVVILAIGVLLFLVFQQSQVENSIKKNGYANFLIIGCDSLKDNISRSDTIILLTVKEDSNKFLVQYIPRDTLITESDKKHKINYYYSRSFKNGGREKAIEDLRKKIQALLNVEIPFFVQVDYAGFEKIVDLIGGIEIYVKKDMFYVDRSDNFTIEIHRGMQHLDGKKGT